ncbi:MAG: TlpA family protein disulfide reductase [Nitrospinae bacterium]|nr:TlpA family protein disulfide reductase [Nitrospinota bacterium]
MSLNVSSAFAYQVGDTVPDEVLKKISKENKVIIVDFFASWCHSCKIELPLLVELYNTINKKDVTIVGIDTDMVLKQGVTFQKSLGINFDVINDTSNEIVSQFQPSGMPALYIIKDGKVEKIREGALNHIDKVLMDDLKELGIYETNN